MGADAACTEPTPGFDPLGEDRWGRSVDGARGIETASKSGALDSDQLPSSMGGACQPAKPNRLPLWGAGTRRRSEDSLVLATRRTGAFGVLARSGVGRSWAAARLRASTTAIGSGPGSGCEATEIDGNSLSVKARQVPVTASQARAIISVRHGMRPVARGCGSSGMSGSRNRRNGFSGRMIGPRVGLTGRTLYAQGAHPRQS
jgi:hypothetical protein